MCRIEQNSKVVKVETKNGKEARKRCKKGIKLHKCARTHGKLHNQRKRIKKCSKNVTNGVWGGFIAHINVYWRVCDLILVVLHMWN